KSDYKIANVTISPQQQQQISGSHKNTNNYNGNTDSDTKTRTDNNNNNNDNNNTSSSRFATIQSSPSLEDSTNTVSTASINVRGINNPVKFENILEDLINKLVSIIGLQETKLSEPAAIAHFKDFTRRFPAAAQYKAYWDFNINDRAAGVGLVIADYISKYVQRVHRHDGRFIAIDLYLPGKKLKIINIYAHQASNYATKG